MTYKTDRTFFVVVILLTVCIIAIQVYWNYAAYKTNEAQYIYKVQRAFDNAVDAYYFEIGKSDVVTLLDLQQTNENESENVKGFLNKAFSQGIEAINFSGDSLQKAEENLSDFSLTENIEGIKIVKGKEALDESQFAEFRKNQVTIRINRDSIDFNLLKQITDSTFQSAGLNRRYNFYHIKKSAPFDSLIAVQNMDSSLTYTSQSDYVERNQQIVIAFDSTKKAAMLKGLIPLLLSLGLSTAILLGILKLISTIKRQKKLSNIKDDFIGNITHEFKTPIATASAAIEALDKFELKNNPEKAHQYLNITEQQLQRLDGMVEKILELSSLDTNKLMLRKEPQDVVQLLKNLVKKFASMAEPKKINFTSELNDCQIHIDTFYFSSAISNLIENAIKYGGERIDILLEKKSGKLHITVRDNGKSLVQDDEAFIFDKFSRKSYGNTYEAEGNGIGLYFTKKIVEKHDGTIRLEVKPDTAAFIVTL